MRSRNFCRGPAIIGKKRLFWGDGGLAMGSKKGPEGRGWVGDIGGTLGLRFEGGKK